MRREYTVTTTQAADPSGRSIHNAGIACAASGIIGVVIGVVTLSYPAAVSSSRWSYPFDATGQWIVGIILAASHLLALAGFVGIIAADPHGRSRAAGVGLRAAVVGFAGLAVCEVLSGAVGTRDKDSSVASALSSGYGVMSLLVAIGSIVAGVVIARRHGFGSGWSGVLWSGVVLLLLVTPANIGDNESLSIGALILWSLVFVPLGLTLMRARTPIVEPRGSLTEALAN